MGCVLVRCWRWSSARSWRADAEVAARVGVGAWVMAEVHTGLETSAGESVGVGVLERQLELVRGVGTVVER
jgi:hypothetical protein